MSGTTNGRREQQLANENVDYRDRYFVARALPGLPCIHILNIALPEPSNAESWPPLSLSLVVNSLAKSGKISRPGCPHCSGCRICRQLSASTVAGKTFVDRFCGTCRTVGSAFFRSYFSIRFLHTVIIRPA